MDLAAKVALYDQPAPVERPTPSVIITEPGLYQITENDYHADPVPGGSLSSSGARKIIGASLAHFHWWAEHPEPPRDVFEFGSAAHAVVLGTGPEIEPLPFDNWTTKAAREARDEHRAAGRLPLLVKDARRVLDMAAVLRDHPIAGALFNPDHGRAEMGLFWSETAAGGHKVWLRALLDWLPDPSPDGRMVVADYKTAPSAEAEEFGRAAMNYGYHQQADWYLSGLDALGLAVDPQFVFVVQEKDPPYVVQVHQLTASAMRIAQGLNRDAVNRYVEARAVGRWPAYAEGVTFAPLPGWYTARFED